MPDRIAYPLFTLVAAGLIALALVWPQGQGSPSPSFGHLLGAAGRTVRIGGQQLTISQGQRTLGVTISPTKPKIKPADNP